MAYGLRIQKVKPRETVPSACKAPTPSESCGLRRFPVPTVALCATLAKPVFNTLITAYITLLDTVGNIRAAIYKVYRIFLIVYSKASYYVLVYCRIYCRYYPKFRAGVLCTIPSVLDIIYHLKIRDSSPEFRPLGHYRLLAVSRRGPKFKP